MKTKVFFFHLQKENEIKSKIKSKLTEILTNTEFFVFYMN